MSVAPECRSITSFVSVGAVARASVAVLICSVPSLSSAAGSAAPAQAQAILLLADVTLIDAQCRNLNPAFGIAFRYAEAQGVQAVDIMPLGRRRSEFQAAYDRRLRAISHDDLCGALARQYD